MRRPGSARLRVWLALMRAGEWLRLIGAALERAAWRRIYGDGWRR